MSVIGVDPGLSGALAYYDSATDTLDITDMPVWHMMVGKKKRARVDAVGLIEYFELAKMMGVQLVVMEAVGGRPRQSASGAFVFGYSVGLIYMACVAVKLPIETVPPQTWKKIMRVPGMVRAKKGEARLAAELKEENKKVDAAIIARCDELFPQHRDKWRGKGSSYKYDRAEAAMLARYAADHALHSTNVVSIKDAEWRLAYRNADVGE